MASLEIKDKVSFTIKVPAVDLVKYFQVGESVRILQGIHSGAAG